ncbi:MAG: hypothetical protein IJ635_07545 [Bacteroidaceae bacterium]|nr:hypothetical protein [Bacteroidaceae bacterium]MBR1521077.1 hypothetical protein [Bacteroidaceae bacterium]
MSLRNNKATRLNRYMMFGTLFLGVIVLGCVFAFLYLSYNKTDNPFVQQPNTEEEAPAVDSIVFIVNDSTLLEE